MPAFLNIPAKTQTIARSLRSCLLGQCVGGGKALGGVWLIVQRSSDYLLMGRKVQMFEYQPGRSVCKAECQQRVPVRGKLTERFPQCTRGGWWLSLAVEIGRNGQSLYFKYILVEELTGPGDELYEGVGVKKV